MSLTYKSSAKSEQVKYDSLENEQKIWHLMIDLDFFKKPS